MHALLLLLHVHALTVSKVQLTLPPLLLPPPPPLLLLLAGVWHQ
jgi:hypothetical protein